MRKFLKADCFVLLSQTRASSKHILFDRFAFNDFYVLEDKALFRENQNVLAPIFQIVMLLSFHFSVTSLKAFLKIFFDQD